MSAEILRAAASLMRSRAEAATPGPWATGVAFATPSEVWHEGNTDTLMVCDTADAYSAENRPGELALEDAAHIASWHPAVALAVADWLTYVADTHDETACPAMVAAEQVAHAYLGEAS